MFGEDMARQDRKSFYLPISNVKRLGKWSTFQQQQLKDDRLVQVHVRPTSQRARIRFAPSKNAGVSSIEKRNVAARQFKATAR